MKSKCLWLVYYLTICWIFFFFSSDSLNCAANIACSTTENRLPSTHGNANKCCCCCCCFEYPLKFLFKSSYQKCLYNYICICQIFLSQRNPVMKIFKTKKNPFIISVTSTLPSPFNPRLWPGLRSNVIVCASFWSVSLISVVQVIRREQPISWAPLYN